MPWMTPARSAPNPTRIPEISAGPRARLPLLHRVSRPALLPGAALLLLAVLLAACETGKVYQPVDSDAMAGRSVMVLQPSRVPPVSRELHGRIIDEVEARLKHFPHLGKLRTRKQVRQSIRDNRPLKRRYALFADTLSVVGIAEREGSYQLGQSQNSELLLMPQLFFLPCPGCGAKSQVALVVNLVEADSGKILWRGHFLSFVDDDEPQHQEEVAKEMMESFFVAFEEDVRPKWHRLRFRTLSGERLN